MIWKNLYRPSAVTWIRLPPGQLTHVAPNFRSNCCRPRVTPLLLSLEWFELKFAYRKPECGLFCKCMWLHYHKIYWKTLFSYLDPADFRRIQRGRRRDKNPCVKLKLRCAVRNGVGRIQSPQKRKHSLRSLRLLFRHSHK